MHNRDLWQWKNHRHQPPSQIAQAYDIQFQCCTKHCRNKSQDRGIAHNTSDSHQSDVIGRKSNPDHIQPTGSRVAVCMPESDI